MQTFRTIGLVLLGALVGAGVFAMRDTVRAQEVQPPSRITVTPIEWSGGVPGVPFRFVRDGHTLKCYLAALNPRDTTITAMVEAAPGACQ